MNPVADFPRLLKQVVGGAPLDAASSANAFAAIISGDISEPQIAAFLTALATREATVEEITGAARAMRAAMRTIKAPEGAIDLCGTGGDGHATFNVSTAVSFVVAACGVPVAKHGNRNMSSRSGAADVLEALGVRIDLSPEAAEACLFEVGLSFLFAPTFHPAMRHVANVRRQLGIRTVFNLLGPICNPAQVKRQLIGVFSPNWTEPVAQVLRELGTERAMVVHGADGLDELTTTDATDAVVLADGRISRLRVTPEQVGLRRVVLGQLTGGDPQFNAKALMSLLEGEGNDAHRDIVCLNAAAALMVAGRAPDLREGLDVANGAIDGGRALAVLNRLRAATRKLAA